MRSVGIRELRERTSEIIGWVRDEGLEVQVTHYGRPVARLVPCPRAQPTCRHAMHRPRNKPRGLGRIGSTGGRDRRALARGRLGCRGGGRGTARAMRVVDASVWVGRLVDKDVHYASSRGGSRCIRPAVGC